MTPSGAVASKLYACRSNRLHPRRLQLVAEPEVHGQLLADLPVVLEEERHVVVPEREVGSLPHPAAVRAGVRRRVAEEERRHGRAAGRVLGRVGGGHRVVEEEAAVARVADVRVPLVPVDHPVVEAELQAVVPGQLVERAHHGPGVVRLLADAAADRRDVLVRQVERRPGLGQLRRDERGSDVEVRRVLAVPRPRDRLEVAGVAEAEGADQRRGEDEGVVQGEGVVAPRVGLHVRDVAPGPEHVGAVEEVRGRLLVVPKVAEAGVQAVVLAELVVEADLVVVGRRGERRAVDPVDVAQPVAGLARPRGLVRRRVERQDRPAGRVDEVRRDDVARDLRPGGARAGVVDVERLAAAVEGLGEVAVALGLRGDPPLAREVGLL